MSEEIDHEFTEYGVCPWCNHEHLDCHELFADPSIEDNETTCESCGKPFSISCHTRISYSTRRIEAAERQGEGG